MLLINLTDEHLKTLFAYRKRGSVKNKNKKIKV